MKKYKVFSHTGNHSVNKEFEGNLEVWGRYYLIITEKEKYYFPIERTIIVEEYEQ